MTKLIEAVYENGVLRPLEPLSLSEFERVRLTVTNEASDPLDEFLDHEFIQSISCELDDVGHIPTLAEIQMMLSHDKSSWSDAIIAERREQ
jgi:predicted DNA-binding antitoxin AbrB/MazE fold protein